MMFITRMVSVLFQHNSYDKCIFRPLHISPESDSISHLKENDIQINSQIKDTSVQ